MKNRPVLVLLPGMDGTGELFRWFRAAIEPFAEPRVVGYPSDPALTLDELVDHVAQQVPGGPYAIVAESFSGPIAIQLASTTLSDLRGVILSTSFAASPWPEWLGNLPLGLLTRARPRAGFSEALLGDAPDEVKRVTEEVVRGIPPAVIAARMRLVLRTDVRDVLRSCPITFACLAGRQDWLVGERGLESVLDARPDIEVSHLDGPHLLLQAKPREAAAAVSEYLSRWFPE
jgi:pimeloyl-ACP methyl ester carboxylesterase